MQKTCKEMLTTRWTNMRLRTQIILKLLMFILLLFAICMIFLSLIFELFYVPDV